MRPKLTDVAKKAGVSKTTVSRVINNYGYISEKTRQQVFRAMKELNYQPNSLARSLHGKSTHLIGIIFPSIMNPFYAELVQRVEEKLFAAGYKIILCNSAQNKEKERDYLKMLIANQVDGIIAGAHNLGIEEYKNVGLPIVSCLKQSQPSVATIIKAALRPQKNFTKPVRATSIFWATRIKAAIRRTSVSKDIAMKSTGST